MKILSGLLTMSVAVLGMVCFVLPTITYDQGRQSKAEAFDGVSYTVNSPDETKAANLLAEINRRIKILLRNLPKNSILHKRFRPENLAESPVRVDASSWSVDKSKIFLCLRDRQTGTFYEADILFFVVVHELAHLASKSYGHNEEFIQNFGALKSLASSLGLVAVKPDISVPYCGTYIIDQKKRAP